jgi:hypothetical protein
VRGGHRARRAQARAPWLAVIRRGRGYCCCTAESRRALALRTDFAYQDTREFRHHHEGAGCSRRFWSNSAKGVSVALTSSRICHSLRHQSNSANYNTRPRAAMRSGFFRRRLLPMRGSFKKPSCCSPPYWSLQTYSTLLSILASREIPESHLYRACSPASHTPRTWERRGMKAYRATERIDSL